MLALADFGNEILLNRGGNPQLTALFGTFSIGVAGYVAVLAQIVAIAMLTAAAARHTVNHTLETVQ
jgi:cell division transport system permease protein